MPNNHAQGSLFNGPLKPGDYYALSFVNCQYSGCHNVGSATCAKCGKRCCWRHLSSYTVTYEGRKAFFCLTCAPPSFFGMLNSLVAKIFLLGVGMSCIVGGVLDLMQRGVRDFNGYFVICFGLLWIWPVIRTSRRSK